MDKVMNDTLIPDDCGVAIEYQIPQSGKRLDFILTGLGEANEEYAILIELKQWSEGHLSEKDGIIISPREESSATSCTRLTRCGRMPVYYRISTKP